MWGASRHGFFSIVRKQGDNWDFFHIRVRLKQDLVNLAIAAERSSDAVRLWPKADYRYRILCSPLDFSDCSNCLMGSIGYDNFKNQIAGISDQKRRLSAYHDIWALLEQLQNE